MELDLDIISLLINIDILRRKRAMSETVSMESGQSERTLSKDRSERNL